MQDKYVVDNAAYCGLGDGPLIPTDPGHAGASGYAWNDFEGMIKGGSPAYGSIAAGDVIHIRALDASDSALTYSWSVTGYLGAAGLSAGEDNGVYWVLDDGTVWSGITGDLTIGIVGNYGWYLQAYNHFFGAPGQRNWYFSAPNLSNGVIYIGDSSDAANSGVHIRDWTLTSTGNARVMTLGKTPIVEDTTIICGTSSAGAVIVASAAGGGGVPGLHQFRNVDVVMNVVTSSTSVLDSIYSQLEWRGGSISGTGVVDGLGLYKAGSTHSQTMHLDGVSVPNIIKPFLAAVTGDSARLIVESSDDKMGMIYGDAGVVVDTKDTANLPYLNASMKFSSAQPFSYRVYPFRASWREYSKFAFSKLWTQTAAAKTITLEFCVEETLDAPTEGSTWMEVRYTDSSDVVRIESTRVWRGTDVLDSSDAAWTPMTGDTPAQVYYGANRFDRYKLALTTAQSIKQDSVVQITFFTSIASTVSSKVLFIDPDPIFS